MGIASRGAVYLDLKQYDNSLIDLDKSLEIEPNNAWALKTRDQVYKMLKRDISDNNNADI